MSAQDMFDCARIGCPPKIQFTVRELCDPSVVRQRQVLLYEDWIRCAGKCEKCEPLTKTGRNLEVITRKDLMCRKMEGFF